MTVLTFLQDYEGYGDEDDYHSLPTYYVFSSLLSAALISTVHLCNQPNQGLSTKSPAPFIHFDNGKCDSYPPYFEQIIFYMTRSRILS